MKLALSKYVDNNILFFRGEGRLYYWNIATKDWVRKAEGEARVAIFGDRKTGISLFFSF
jgi:uncharacterized protein (DUF2252 family)